MASRVYLHIGLPKTGTSYLQSILRGNMAALKEQGLLLPGSRHDHYRASLDVRDQADAPGLRADPDHVRGAWKHLVEQARAWPGTVLLTNELLAGAQVQSIARIVEDVSPAEVHVIVTVRNLARALPAAWQQSVKSGRRTNLSDFIAGVRDETPATRWFRRVQFADRVLSRWQRHVPKERIHVVTVPPEGSPRELLWQRFSEILGIAPDSCELTTTANESLGAVEAELLWRVNVHLVPRLGKKEVSTWVRDELGNDILAQSDHRLLLAIPDDVRPWVAQRSRSINRRLGRAGYDIRGDLEDLNPSPCAAAATSSTTVQTEEVLDAATETIAELVVRLRDAHLRARAAQRRAHAARRRAHAARRRASSTRRKLVRLRADVRRRREGSRLRRALAELRRPRR